MRFHAPLKKGEGERISEKSEKEKERERVEEKQTKPRGMCNFPGSGGLDEK